MTLKDRIKLAFSGWTSRIKAGPLAGFRWISVSGGRFVRGTYEPDSTAVFLQHVRPGAVVFDIGAHVGYYSVLASHLAGATGKVFAFEPRPFNLKCLLRHRELNGLPQLQAFDVCVGAKAASARFESRTGSGTGHLAADGDLSVTVISLDDWLREGRLAPPDFVKIDVEGAEREVLSGAQEMLKSRRPKLLLSLHSVELNRWAQAHLRDHGYRLTYVQGTETSEAAEVLAIPGERN